MVPSAAPLVFKPRSAEFFDFDRRFSALTDPDISGLKIVISARLPTAMDGLSIPKRCFNPVSALMALSVLIKLFRTPKVCSNIKGNALRAFVILLNDKAELDMENEIKELISKTIGPIAKPDIIQIVPGLPKTRSGKIMRRIYLPQHFKVVFRIDRSVLWGQVTHVPERGEHGVIRSQILVDCLGFSR